MSWQPFNFMTPVAASGNISATTLFVASVSGYYVVSIYMEPTSTSAVTVATLSLGFTSNGVARTLSQPSLSLASMSSTMSNYQMIYADAGTPVTFTLSGMSTGGARLHIGWKPQGS